LGTFVARPKILVDLQRLKGFTDDMRLRGFRPGGRLLELKRIPMPADVAVLFHLQPGPTVQLVVRVRTANRGAIGVHQTYLAPELEVSEEDLKARESLYAILRERYGIVPMDADETFEAVPAKAEIAKLLFIRTGAALLHVERVSYDQRGRPIEVSRMLYRGDRYRYYAKLRA
jgi:GntR family transcriptional regulator